MEEQKNHIDRLIEHGGTYLKNKQDLIQLNVTEKTVVMSSSAISSGFILAILLFALVFLGIALALWIGKAMNNQIAGFAIVGAVYLLLTIILLLAKRSIIERPIMNAMIRQNQPTIKGVAIQNIDQLQAEVVRLKNECDAGEKLVREDLATLRNDLKPSNILLNIISGVTGIRFNADALGKGGILYGLSLLLQRLMLKAEKKAEDTAYGLIDVLFKRIQDFVHRHTSHDARRDERADEPKKDA
jgi:hypothetical protein